MIHYASSLAKEVTDVASPVIKTRVVAVTRIVVGVINVINVRGQCTR